MSIKQFIESLLKIKRIDLSLKKTTYIAGKEENLAKSLKGIQG